MAHSDLAIQIERCKQAVAQARLLRADTERLLTEHRELTTYMSTPPPSQAFTEAQQGAPPPNNRKPHPIGPAPEPDTQPLPKDGFRILLRVSFSGLSTLNSSSGWQYCFAARMKSAGLLQISAATRDRHHRGGSGSPRPSDGRGPARFEDFHAQSVPFQLKSC